MKSSKKVLVAGAGGFIGGWVIKDLLKQGYTNVRGVDIKPLVDWYQKFDNVENLSLDLKDPVNTLAALMKLRMFII